MFEYGILNPFIPEYLKHLSIQRQDQWWQIMIHFKFFWSGRPGKVLATTFVKNEI